MKNFQEVLGQAAEQVFLEFVDPLIEYYPKARVKRKSRLQALLREVFEQPIKTFHSGDVDDGMVNSRLFRKGYDVGYTDADNGREHRYDSDEDPDPPTPNEQYERGYNDGHKIGYEAGAKKAFQEHRDKWALTCTFCEKKFEADTLYPADVFIIKTPRASICNECLDLANSSARNISPNWPGRHKDNPIANAVYIQGQIHNVYNLGDDEMPWPENIVPDILEQLNQRDGKIVRVTIEEVS